MEDPNSTETIIMATLSTLTPPQLSHLTHSISSLFHRHRRRLSTLLSSPTNFSLTLHHLHSLSLHHKSLLIARHLLSTLTHLTRFFHTTTTPPSFAATAIKLRDLDAALLLLLLCELRQHDPEALKTSPSKWRIILCNYVSHIILTLSGVGVSNGAVLFQYIEVVAKCRRFVGVMGCGGKEGRLVAASVAGVVALPSVEVSSVGRECAICKEEMREGREVCELPCDHLFHWMCILPWLGKRNTCPCCRHRLPTDDVFGEIERLWDVLVKVGNGSNL
uniref:RING-type E3 ubiquitin transferase n=1 Tax=Davidia involucrata TaxID=16924 RepID=A0A5B6ZCB4_DAVIN